jgi:hypothetical protein
VDAPFTCEALLKDRFGNVLGRETQVVFRSEAAAVGQVVWTPRYDGDSGPQIELGVALQAFTTLGAGLPFDVDPDPAVPEPSVDHDLDGCGLGSARTHNPRDGLVTMIAIADGEEAFWDANGNGSFDAGEPFVDQGEPFVDQDDDGAYDAGEWFLDVDRSSDHTAANGTWDASTKIWTQTVVVYTGRPETLVSTGNHLGVRISDAYVDACTPTTPTPSSFDVDVATTVTPAESDTYWVYASDMNLNFLHMGTSYEVTTRGAGGVDVQYWGFDSYADDIGMSYTYQPCNTAAGGTCAAQCQATGGTRCEMVPSLTAFSCGLDGARVDLTAASAGPVSVDWAVQTPWNRYGTSAFWRTVRSVGGVVRDAP